MSVGFVTLFPALRRAGDSLRESVGPQAVAMGFAVALVALGSLYLSEVARLSAL